MATAKVDFPRLHSFASRLYCAQAKHYTQWAKATHRSSTLTLTDVLAYVTYQSEMGVNAGLIRLRVLAVAWLCTSRGMPDVTHTAGGNMQPRLADALYQISTRTAWKGDCPICLVNPDDYAFESVTGTRYCSFCSACGQRYCGECSVSILENGLELCPTCRAPGAATDAEQYSRLHKLLRERPYTGFTALAQLRLANVCQVLTPRRCDEAAALMEQAAGDGFAQAQYELACMYMTGNCVQLDLDQAHRWFTQSAEQGLTDAQLALANMYMAGIGVPVNEPMAVAWYTKAATHGNVPSMRKLGVYLAVGRGTKLRSDHSVARAMKWFQQAADKGDPESRYWLEAYQTDIALKCMQGIGTNIGIQQAVVWCTRAAEAGDQKAMFMLGRYYYKATGPEHDLAKAKKWLQLAGEQGNAPALEWLNLEKDWPTLPPGTAVLIKLTPTSATGKSAAFNGKAGTVVAPPIAGVPGMVFVKLSDPATTVMLRAKDVYCVAMFADMTLR